MWTIDKMSEKGARGYISQSDNHYLCSLPAMQVSQADLGEFLVPVVSGEESRLQVKFSNIQGNGSASEEPYAPTSEVIAEGFYLTMAQALGGGVKAFTWQEKMLVVHSFGFFILYLGCNTLSYSYWGYLMIFILR